MAKWTKKLKSVAAKQLLEIANAYEVKQRTRLVGIRYGSDGSAKWSGRAHDYTVWNERK